MIADSVVFPTPAPPEPRVIPLSESWPLMVPFLLVCVFGLVAFLLWFGSFTDIMRKEKDAKEKAYWTLMILLVPILGPLCYLFIRRPQRG